MSCKFIMLKDAENATFRQQLCSVALPKGIRSYGSFNGAGGKKTLHELTSLQEKVGIRAFKNLRNGSERVSAKLGDNNSR